MNFLTRCCPLTLQFGDLWLQWLTNYWPHLWLQGKCLLLMLLPQDLWSAYVCSLTSRPQSCFSPRQVHPRSDFLAVMDSSLPASPWNLPTDGQSEPRLFFLDASHLVTSLLTVSCTYRPTWWGQGTRHTPGEKRFAVFYCLLESPAPPPCGNVSFHAGGPAGTYLDKREGILSLSVTYWEKRWLTSCQWQARLADLKSVFHLMVKGWIWEKRFSYINLKGHCHPSVTCSLDEGHDH